MLGKMEDDKLVKDLEDIDKAPTRETGDGFSTHLSST
jgi:hypothetical protein